MVYAATAPDEHRAKMVATRQVSPLAASQKTIITQAVLGGDAGLYGAARLPVLGTG
jgi:hypothetical protein